MNVLILKIFIEKLLKKLFIFLKVTILEGAKRIMYIKNFIPFFFSRIMLKKRFTHSNYQSLYILFK